MPTKRCSWGLCNSDRRYADRPHMEKVDFVPFPKPIKSLEKCLRWIMLCGRTHEQLNVNRIKVSTCVCTKHFKDQKWPTVQFPDPAQAPQVKRRHVQARRRPETKQPYKLDIIPMADFQKKWFAGAVNVKKEVVIDQDGKEVPMEHAPATEDTGQNGDTAGTRRQDNVKSTSAQRNDVKSTLT